jgi:hypothetical protein
MLSAVKLNNQLFRNAVKIENKALYGVLLAESEPIDLFSAQALPQQLFRIGHILA